MSIKFLSGVNVDSNTLFVDAANDRVGIGTASPVQKLDVRGFIVSDSQSNASESAFYLGNSAHGLSRANLQNDIVLYTTSGDVKISANTASTTQLIVTNAGNVGIGTTAPADQLSISNSAGTSISITTGQAAGSIASPKFTDINFRGYLNTPMARIRSWDESSSTADGYLTFWTNDFDGVNNFTEKMRITPTGNVGIGTTSPSQALHVSGSARVTGAYYDSSNSAGSSGQVLSSTGSGTDWVSLSEISGVDGTGTANYVAKWSDTDTIANSQIVDNGTNVGINNATPKTKLDINGAIGFGSKTMSMTDTFAAALTLNMNDHNGCYVKLTAFGDWSNHSTIAYLGEFFVQASAGAYNEPGIIIRQVDNTAGGDDIQAQIVDPAGTGTRDFVIQLKATSASNTPFTAYLQYEVRGMYNSVS